MPSSGIRAQVFSDLHQEWPGNAWDPGAHAPTDGFDVAVVAGDIHMPLTQALDWLGERLPGVPVVYVPGNHDFQWDRGEDRYTIHDQLERGLERASKLGIHLLLDDAVMIGGTRFLGGTLWTDFRLGSQGLTHAFRTAQGRYGMVDYRPIRTGPRSRNRIEPGEVMAMHRATRAFIEAEFARPFRRQRARPGLTKCDAASLLGISMPTLAELMRRGYVSSLGHEATGTSRTRVDEHSLRAFAMQYASAVTYADVLGCGRTYTVEKLRQLGVEIILKEPGHGHLMAMVRRSDVTSALGLDRDPLTTTSSGWIGFWSAFGEHLASKGSIFRLVRITSEPDNRLQSGDRRTVISIEMDAEGRSILRQETGHGANEGTFAVREGFALQDRRSWPQLFVWLETSAYLLRSAGGRGSAAA